MANKVKASELRDMAPAELHRKVDEISTQLFELRRKQATGQVDNPARLGQLRRERARVLTVLKEKKA